MLLGTWKDVHLVLCGNASALPYLKDTRRIHNDLKPPPGVNLYTRFGDGSRIVDDRRYRSVAGSGVDSAGTAYGKMMHSLQLVRKHRRCLEAAQLVGLVWNPIPAKHNPGLGCFLRRIPRADNHNTRYSQLSMSLLKICLTDVREANSQSDGCCDNIPV